MRYDTFNQDDELVFTCTHKMLIARREAEIPAAEIVTR